MTREQKDRALKAAYRALPRAQFEKYRNFIENYETVSRRNDAYIVAKYEKQIPIINN